jgi:hypothetical protein
MKPLLSAFAAIWLAVSISHGQGVTDRETMGGRAWTCIQARFYVAPDSANRYSNLLNPKYQGCGGVCQTASDIYTDTQCCPVFLYIHPGFRKGHDEGAFLL